MPKRSWDILRTDRHTNTKENNVIACHLILTASDNYDVVPIGIFLYNKVEHGGWATNPHKWSTICASPNLNSCFWASSSIEGKTSVTQTDPLFGELLSSQSVTQQSAAIMSSLAVLRNTFLWEIPSVLMRVSHGGRWGDLLVLSLQTEQRYH